MDTSMFERKIENLRKGNYVTDPALYEYANNAMYESRLLMNALKECCQNQSGRMEILRRMNEELAESVKRLMIENRELKDRLAGSDVRVEVDYGYSGKEG